MLKEAKTEAVVFYALCCRAPLIVDTINVCGCDTTAQSFVRDIGVFMDNTLCLSTQVARTCRGIFPTTQDRKNSKMLNDPRVQDDRTHACYTQTGLWKCCAIWSKCAFN